GDSLAPDRWWTSFGNETLTAWVDSAITSNFTLQSAWQRLRASRAVVKREQAPLFPTLEANVSADRQRFAATGNIREELGMGLSTIYEVDLWGRIRSAIEAEQLRAEATLYDYQAAAITLSAEVTTNWFELAEANAQLSLVNEQIETNERVLSLLRNRFGSGQIRAVDILRQEQLLESTIEQRLSAEERIAILKNQFSVLIGRIPSDEISLKPGLIDKLPPLPETGIPLELIERRPDVQAAYNQLLAADRDVASAISSQYPRLSFRVNASTFQNNATSLFEDFALSFAGNLIAPIFLGRELQAEVDRTEAVQTELLYDYGQSVLIAFREVEDALTRERKQRERIESINKQVELAQRAYDQLRVQYLNGAINYLDVLTALNEVQQLQRDQLSAKLDLLRFRIALYRALSGSFNTERENQAGL
ncbi:MAG: efflux transporter outer membrane subunit, partial [Bacteroidetes bacterium]|nr:efflux transporter outer membrane subunit [Bacteroidota bacterium]